MQYVFRQEFLQTNTKHVNLVGGRREAISFQPFKRLFDYINSYMAVIKNSEKCIICASFGVFIPNSED